MSHFVAFFLRPSSPLFANDQVSKFCQFYARWCCSAVHSSSTNETTSCSKEPACFWHSLAVCQHVSIFFADIWRESGQAELSGFSWQRTSHKNWSCGRQAEGGQQHQQVSFPESRSWIALQSWSKNRGTSVGIGVRWFWNDWGNDEQAVWIFSLVFPMSQAHFLICGVVDGTEEHSPQSSQGFSTIPLLTLDDSLSLEVEDAVHCGMFGRLTKRWPPSSDNPVFSFWLTVTYGA